MWNLQACRSLIASGETDMLDALKSGFLARE
jgi:hypothetical protein